MLPEREAPEPDPHGVLHPPYPVPAEGPGGQRRGAVPPHLGGRVLHQEQQYHHGAYKASAGKDGGFFRESEIYQDGLGVRVQN